MGWIPPDQFKGDKTKFISAQDFVQRGESFMPILKANNKRLTSQFDDLRRQNGVLSTQLSEALNELDQLKKGSVKASVEDLKSKRSALASDLKAAREANDTEKEVEIQAEIADVNDKIREGEKEASAPVTKRTAQNGNQPPPGFQEFVDAHPWYGTDKRKTRIANAIGEEVLESNPGIAGKAFFSKVAEALEEEFGNPRRNGTSRVEGGARGTSEGGGGSSNGKSYADLPAEAKAACDSQAKRYSGEGKKYKDVAAYRAYYVNTYFNS
jgi:hypothetical protein